MNNAKHNCDLKSCFFCTQCLPDWLPAIEANRKTLHYKKGQIIFEEGHDVAGIYFVYQGKVKVHKKGMIKSKLYALLTKVKSLDIEGWGHQNQYPVSATAIEPTSACFIS